MSKAMSTRSTLLAILIAAALLGVTTAFVAFAPEDEGVGGTSSEAGLPEGFAVIPDDVFVERVFGAQRAAGSWHIQRERVLGGTVESRLSADVVISGGDTDLDGTLKRVEQVGTLVELQARVVSGETYLRNVGSTGPWWHLRPGDPDADRVLQAIGGDLSVETGNDLQDAIGDVTTVGADSVEGVTVVHYRATLVTPGPSEGEAPSLEMDFWVDEQDRPVRIEATAGVESGEATVTWLFTEYGADYAISVPEQVTETAPGRKR